MKPRVELAVSPHYKGDITHTWPTSRRAIRTPCGIDRPLFHERHHGALSRPLTLSACENSSCPCQSFTKLTLSDGLVGPASLHQEVQTCPVIVQIASQLSLNRTCEVRCGLISVLTSRPTIRPTHSWTVSNHAYMFYKRKDKSWARLRRLLDRKMYPI